ncbi:membrane protein [Mycobacterium phage JF4]|uniref:Membrane protein n=3 Tax=Veracruzvirus TaxID=2948946 RepID=A0A6M3TBE8_9CAUD|nr:hypothetical protein M614_gp37 [Mycobacterium phage BTCU-1]QGJ97320.1 hypothetical protein PBI_ISCA_38 [Mycobacterium phage Isca]QJD52014.1 membrane protein [Mycobacterium phage MK4]QJD52173.1 membrane protein [Mycobacterium phage JF4]QJD52253.1 membrane protein [Mycobacterium phage JF2]BBC53757.1 hypothetical protein [Mycobacterium phage B1]
MKVVAALLLLIAAVLSVTACEPSEGGSSGDDTYPHGVIFMPPMNPGGPMMPIFY